MMVASLPAVARMPPDWSVLVPARVSVVPNALSRSELAVKFDCDEDAVTSTLVFVVKVFVP